MPFPTLGRNDGIPKEYQNSTWVRNSQYQGGGYWAGYSLGYHYSYAQLEKLWIDAGGDPKVAPQMASIAEAESGGYAGAWNSTGATSLWQSEWPANYKGPRKQLFIPIIAARNAVKLYKQAGFTPWGNDPRTDRHIPPARTVPFEHVAVGKNNAPVTSGGGGGGIVTTSIITNILGGGLTSNWKDYASRLGLILLGGVLVLVGIWLIAGQTNMKLEQDIIGAKKKNANP